MIGSIWYGPYHTLYYGYMVWFYDSYYMTYCGQNRMGESLVTENIKPFHKIKIPTTTPSEFLSNLVMFGKNV